MEPSRHGVPHENEPYSSLPVGWIAPPSPADPPLRSALLAAMPDEDDLDEWDTQTIPGYLTLELDISGFPVFAPDASAVPSLEETPLYGPRELEPEPLALPEGFDVEEATIPGYLTIEIDLNALGEAPPRTSDNVETDTPHRKVSHLR